MDVTMTLKNRSSPSPSSAPFKRGRSKVFYASENPSLPKLSSKYSLFETSEKDSKMIAKKCNRNPKSDVPPWGPVLDTCKEANEASSSGDETNSPTIGAIRSPVGSLRSSIGGSLRGSQDSGYSDSGESNCGGSPEIDPEEFAPRVKHISRVFFGDSSGSGRARLYSDTIVPSSGSLSLPVNSRIACDGISNLPRSPNPSCVLRDPTDAHKCLRSSPTSVCDFDEPQDEMECKSLLDLSTNSYDEQASRKTGAIRKSSYVSCHRKGPRRSTSADKLLDDLKPRRPCILKARRRWSTVDVKHTSAQCSGPQSLPFMTDCHDGEHRPLLNHLDLEQEAPLKPILTDPCGFPGPAKKNTKRFRIHPTALAAEMKNGSLSQWLVEVRCRAETECMNTLQSKSLAADPPAFPLSALDAVRSVQRRAHTVSTEFARLCQRLEVRHYERLPALSRSLVGHINAFLREPPGPSAGAAGPKSAVCRQIEVVRQICHRLMEITTANPSDFTSSEDQFNSHHNYNEDVAHYHSKSSNCFEESNRESHNTRITAGQVEATSQESNDVLSHNIGVTQSHAEESSFGVSKSHCVTEESLQRVTVTQCNLEEDQDSTKGQCDLNISAQDDLSVLSEPNKSCEVSLEKCDTKAKSQNIAMCDEHVTSSAENVTNVSTHDGLRTNCESQEKLQSSSGVQCHSKRTSKAVKETAQVVTALGHAFTKLVDILLSVEIKAVISSLESDSSSRDEVRSALRQLTSLGVDGGHVCRLIARLGGVRALLALCVEPGARALRVAALRALATVCCVVDGIAHLEKAGGMEVIVEVLCDEGAAEDERSEAAAVLAQITSPWVDQNHGIVSLARHVAPLVTALTDLIRATQSAEIFLLGSAALANLTFLADDGLVAAMLAADTPSVLLQAANTSHGLSVFTKDQIATVVSSVCSSSAGAAAVVAGGGITTLLQLLHTPPPPHPARMPEITATERVQQKAAIAISRLCSDAECAAEVLQDGGGARLVRLCRDEAERNHSDAVLVACLAALRKIASSCEKEKLRDIGAAELVEPRLLDSFLTFSSRQESYV
ncbi:uncharacterized protein LOC108667885 isoform X2 [Hyalella azteca]|uniref:Uncharacterized protein LOC108667885 isoform X2 n=1 Tax=Hyalella azteca TaxID=294128 RepID=A0A979FUV9_HYAAZ|nr:uncharacterized protein LOC108667885 isoform X2 [Hyalella azteca]